jgi:hypothetical protein
MPNIFGFEPLTPEEEATLALNRYVICFHSRAVGNEPFHLGGKTFHGRPVVYQSVDDAVNAVNSLNETIPQYFHWLHWQPHGDYRYVGQD